MARFVFVALFALACFAQDSKPACNKKISGQFWPAEANQDARVARAYSRCGALEICTMNGGWRFKWAPVSVHVSQFSADPQKAAAACLASPPAQSAANSAAAPAANGN